MNHFRTIFLKKAAKSKRDPMCPNRNDWFWHKQTHESLNPAFKASRFNLSKPKDFKITSRGVVSAIPKNGGGGGPKKSAHDLAKHKCAHCPMAFSNARTFKDHQRVHQEHWEYKCSTCEARFEKEVHLQRYTAPRAAFEIYVIFISLTVSFAIALRTTR